MTETNHDTVLQGKLDLLKRQYERGRLTEDEYHDEIAQLGIDPATLLSPPPPVNLAALRARLERLDDVQIEQVTIDYFPEVKAKFSAGMRRDAKINELLDHCRRNPEAVPSLTRALDQLPASCDPASALACYLTHVIEEHRALQLQGIRSATGLVSVELEEVYVTLTATVRRAVADEDALHEMPSRQPVPNRMRESAGGGQTHLETVKVQVQEALRLYPRLVVLGDPGCGKTTLLRYLALTYARDFSSTDATDLNGIPSVQAVQSVEPSPVQQRLGLSEHRLPILLPLRDFARFLEKDCPDNGADGPKLLLDYLHTYFTNQQLALPPDFFAARLKAGACVVLLDGVDEVASMPTRQRVARIVEKFTLAYPDCRTVVTSRIVGYTGGARLAAGFEVTTVRDFTDEDITRFVRHWNRAVEVTLAGKETPHVLRKAEAEAQKLLGAIRGNARVRELAVNPLLLTVIALVQRYRAQLPERRVELYEEAIEVLLVQWDAVKGLKTIAVLEGLNLDAGDRRTLLEPVALWLMEQRGREIELDDLRKQLALPFQDMLKDWRQTAKAVEGFVDLIRGRSGLLTERGPGEYAFSHLTFQEYLAARVIAERADGVAYTLARLGDSWWREVVLLEVGHLSTLGKRRATALLRAIIDCPDEPAPYHNLILAAEAVRDVGPARLEGDLSGEIQRRLRTVFETPLRKGAGDLREQVQRRAAAAEALGRIESEGFGAQPAFWRLPHGEPVWVDVPAGEFWMGTPTEKIDMLIKRYGGERKWYEPEVPQHLVFLEHYQISRTPITNAQYRLFVEATGGKAPQHWGSDRPPKDLENHPVVYVSWHDAMAYCRWLSEVTGKVITLPAEAQWEKAARGGQDKREYPWGDDWDATKCNAGETGLGGTSPVGIFPEGSSPYGCLDLAGNVLEWMTTLWGPWNKKESTFELQFPYPYRADDGRENLEVDDNTARVLRGGAFLNEPFALRCAFRYRLTPNYRINYVGFRVVVSPSALHSGTLHSSLHSGQASGTLG